MSLPASFSTGMCQNKCSYFDLHERLTVFTLPCNKATTHLPSFYLCLWAVIRPEELPASKVKSWHFYSDRFNFLFLRKADVGAQPELRAGGTPVFQVLASGPGRFYSAAMSVCRHLEGPSQSVLEAPLAIATETKSQNSHL